MNEITVIIADDHPIVRQGLRQTIELEEDIKIVAEAEDGKQALKFIKEFQPKIAILDINMPELDGFEVVRAMQDCNLETEIIFLTIHRDEIRFNEAIDLGAKGYILKQSAVENIIDGIRTVAKSEYYTSPTLTTFLINRNQKSLKLADQTQRFKNLTLSETRILQKIADYKSTREIADDLFISPTTVEKHRANICSKLNLKGSNSLLRFAVMHRSELL
ncbi:MAG TPA: response regulator transcription factor [Pyrinomonadaceae bacterium]|nr:response regulator transcription factor [Pyrinomonadaceae bacterium]